MPSTIGVLKPHISINVRNVERSIAFYRQMLGIEPSKVRTGYAKFDIQNPPLNLALNEVADLTGAGALSVSSPVTACTRLAPWMRNGSPSLIAAR